MAPRTIPELVAHRGWPAQYPENTLEGFAAAVEAGARYLECDVQISADGVAFVSHDVSLKRTGGLARDITSMSAAELGTITVGERQHFGNRYAAVKLPALETLTRWLKTRPQVRLFVEIKRQSLRYHGVEPVVTKIMATLRPVLDQCIVISFDHACLVLAHEQDAAAIGWAVEQVTDETRRIADMLQPNYLFSNEKSFSAIHRALPGPWQWIPYHTEEVGRALELAQQGAAFVETNDIGTMLKSPEFTRS